MSEQQTIPDTTDAVGSSGSPLISQGEAAGITPTSGDNLEAPGQDTHQPRGLSFEQELHRLDAFLATTFPHETGRTNVQRRENPVDLAIRLLSGLAATAPAAAVERCDQAYCNKTLGHQDIHGWVHFG